MKIAIHQPHYFPWLGYFDKMIHADSFVLLDEVQLEKGSQMIRNRVVDEGGEIRFLTLSAEKTDYLQREYRDIKTKDVQIWTKRQLDALNNYYRRAAHRDEIMPILEKFFASDIDTVCGWTCASIELVRKLLGITTPVIFQSQIDYDRDARRSELVLEICLALKAETYLSGTGASVRYLDRERFEEKSVGIEFQSFTHPTYPQCGKHEFTGGLSILDALFNCGVAGTAELLTEKEQ